jgi:hypothetical protein
MMTWNIAGSPTAIFDSVIRVKRAAEWCIILTEVKHAAHHLKRTLRNTHTVHISSSTGKSTDNKSSRPEAKGGVLIALNKPFGAAGQHSYIQVPEALRGYALHITQNLPGGKKIHIIGVYSPSDNTQLKHELIEYIHNLLQTTEWDEDQILLIGP